MDVNDPKLKAAIMAILEDKFAKSNAEAAKQILEHVESQIMGLIEIKIAGIEGMIKRGHSEWRGQLIGVRDVRSIIKSEFAEALREIEETLEEFDE